MDPDACALLLEKIDGPKKKARRPNKYTFTIKVVEAEDLKACDANGYSDPYVVFGDEYQKRLHKTRIIHKSLNPRWDETFDITVQGPVNMIATIWDYDTFGDHDYVGRTSLKLDPVHFSDYLPREFWLDLDSQGRLLIRVSMEGERDDIQFHFGKAFRHLKRTERDMVRKVTDKVMNDMPKRTYNKYANLCVAHFSNQPYSVFGDPQTLARNRWHRCIRYKSLEEASISSAYSDSSSNRSGTGAAILLLR